jgi:hypothetical protein
MLALPRRERSADGLDFVNTCKAEYDRLIEQSPAVPTSILNEFEKEYPLDNIFTKPEILDVRAIPKLKVANVTESVTKGGPFSKWGELVKSKSDYNEKTKLLDEMQSEEEEAEEYEEEEDAKSSVSEEQTDVEQGIPKE